MSAPTTPARCSGCAAGHPREWDRMRWPWQVVHRVPGVPFSTTACEEPMSECRASARNAAGLPEE